MDPPPLPPGTIYTSHWCEENIYLLCQAFSADAQVSRAWHISVIFISNFSKSVALWSQKLSPEPGHAVVWDYHAILVLRPADATNTGAQSWVYDFDSCLPMPCPFPVYVQHTFSAGLPGAYQSVFRVVESRAFVDHFASDRSHMLTAAVSNKVETQAEAYHKPPPGYPPICGPIARERGTANNLMGAFVSMSEPHEVGGMFGDITDLGSFIQWGMLS